MRFIQFTLSDKTKFTVTHIQADRILNSPQQIIQITNSKGEWDGRTINKAHIVATDRDFEAERQHRIHNAPRLAPPKEEEISEAQKKRIEKRRKEIGDMLRYGTKPRVGIKATTKGRA